MDAPSLCRIRLILRLSNLWIYSPVHAENVKISLITQKSGVFNADDARDTGIYPEVDYLKCNALTAPTKALHVYILWVLWRFPAVLRVVVGEVEFSWNKGFRDISHYVSYLQEHRIHSMFLLELVEFPYFSSWIHLFTDHPPKIVATTAESVRYSDK